MPSCIKKTCPTSTLTRSPRAICTRVWGTRNAPIVTLLAGMIRKWEIIWKWSTLTANSNAVVKKHSKIWKNSITIRDWDIGIRKVGIKFSSLGSHQTKKQNVLPREDACFVIQLILKICLIICCTRESTVMSIMYIWTLQKNVQCVAKYYKTEKNLRSICIGISFCFYFKLWQINLFLNCIFVPSIQSVASFYEIEIEAEYMSLKRIRFLGIRTNFIVWNTKQEWVKECSATAKEN